jgi:hypothetical protein
LLRVAPYCVPGSVGVVSGARGLRVARSFEYETLVCDTSGGRASSAAQTQEFVCLFPSQNLRPETGTGAWLVRQWREDAIREGDRGVATKAKVTEEGLLIPKEVTDRALGEGSEEVEIFEEPGRLVVAMAGNDGERESAEIPLEPVLQRSGCPR